MTQLAFFISGTGGNAMNLLRACREGRVPAEPVIAIASTPKAGGIAKLEAEGIPVVVIERKAFDSDEAYSEACYAAVEARGASIICLAGWLKKLWVPPTWEGRILNIHPGLLPAFGGAGMYGMHVHRAVIAAGARESGCTVHLVDNEFDHGRHLKEHRVLVLADDTAESLQARVYAEEMKAYPEALRDFLTNR